MPVLGMGGCDWTTDAARPPSLGADLVRTAARMRRSVACLRLETQPSIGGSVRDAARAPSLPDAMSAVLLQLLLAGGVPANTVNAETAVHLMRVDAADGGLARRQTCRVLVLVSAAGLAGAGARRAPAMLRERRSTGWQTRRRCSEALARACGASGRSRRSPSRLQRPQRFQWQMMNL